MTTDLNRRQFLGYAAAGGAALTAGIGKTVYADSPNERIIVGVVGMGRGRSLAGDFASAPGCTVKYVCDTDSTRLAGGVDTVQKAGGNTPEAVGDFRRILEDPEIDAAVFALPIHWHAPAAILACQAGKHVYVEKPCCHNPHEGELLVQAARKYNRAVQMGNQRRSSAAIREGMDKLLGGAIGRSYYARGWYSSLRESMGRGAETSAPAPLNYDLWQGPAPRRPYKDNVIHYNWHWLWHYGTGELGNNGTHILDMCRWGLGVDYPVRVAAAGGRYRYEDDQETPDTVMVTYDFDGGKTVTWEGLSCNQPGSGGNAVGVTFYGEGGSITFGSTNYILRDNDGKTLEQRDGDLGGAEHVVNLLDAIRQETPLSLRSEIEEGYKSALLSHLGNIAWRTGHLLRCGEQGHILDDAEAQALWRREYEPGWEPTA
jgi:predicted dehydrogenase